MFPARDPAITACVVAFADSQSGWYLSGRWQVPQEAGHDRSMTPSTVDISLTGLRETSAECHFRLMALSELPQARLRRPRSTWNEADQVAATVIELLGVIDATQFRYDDSAVAQRLARLTPPQVAAFDAALLAIGAKQQRRLLGLLQQALVAGVEPTPAQRPAVIAERLAANDRLVLRIKYDIDSDEIARLLCAFLDDSPDHQLPQLPSYESPVTTPSWPLVPTPAPRARRTDGRHHLFILRDDDETAALLDEWIGTNPATRRFDGNGARPVASYSAALQYDQVPMWGPLTGAVIGESRSDGSSPRFLHKYWLFGSDPPQAAALDSMSAEFRWALFQWRIALADHGLALLTDDASLACRFEALLQTAHVIPSAAFLGVDRLANAAGGLSFCETTAFGEAALAAAEVDEEQPWLVLAAREGQGYWWREASAQLDPQASHWTVDAGQPLMIVVYRGSDSIAWRELWSRIGCDSNVAVAAVSGRVPIHMLRERLIRTKDHFPPDNLRYLAGDAWAYAHTWGGGSDEHCAQFYSHDAAVTERVVAFAAAQWPDRAMYHAHW